MRMLCVVIAALALTACEASFEDLRDDSQMAPNNIDPLIDPLANNGTPDMGATPDSGTTRSDVGQTSEDMGTEAEMGMDSRDAGEPDPGGETVVAMGQVQPRANYGGEGTISLVQLADDSYELRFEDDFDVGGVPGPVVVLSLEGTLGNNLDPQRGDVELGVLERDSGASSYALPFAPGERRFAWVYCKPFGLEVIRAELMDVN